MKRFFYFLIAIICISCSEQKEATFSLTGTSNGIEKGTILYLENSLTKEIIDSASVENNSFEFHTILPNSPMETLLFTKDYSQYRYMWLETKPMTFDATTSDFRKAIIQGSAPEKLRQEFYNSIDTLPRSERQKMEKEFVRDNPNSIVSASKLSSYTTTWGR